MPHLQKTCALLAALWIFLIVTPAWSGQAEEALNEGLKLHDAGKPKEAIREYDRAVKMNPKLADAYFNRGNAYYDLGQNELGDQGLQRSDPLNPQGRGGLL